MNAKVEIKLSDEGLEAKLDGNVQDMIHAIALAMHINDRFKRVVMAAVLESTIGADHLDKIVESGDLRSGSRETPGDNSPD